MSTPSLWDRLKKARVVRILLFYGGVSWVVLQITETLTGLLSLPEWVGPVAVLLLFVGLVVVLATAWVQSLPQTTAREEAGEIPTDWQVAPGDVFASLRRGRLPHLTWGRAILGGVFALALLFGVAGLYVIVRGPDSLLGPAEAGAEGTSSGIAVLPFHVTGPDLDLYREGMVDLVSANLDGLSGFRAVDSRTVLARWSRDVGDGEEAELNDALRVAAGTGARYAVVGSGVELGGTIRFSADIYDLDTREKVGSGQVEGGADEVLGLVDALTVDVMRSLLEATERGSTAQDFRLASLLTESVPALREYLEGDAAFRRGRFEEAREHLERAVQEDSTFALAHWRLGEALGWIDGITDPESLAHKDRAAELRDRLPPREATLLEVSASISNQRPEEELPVLEEYLARYPDDPDGWYFLEEVGFHNPVVGGPSDRRVEKALYEAVELDPTFGPYYQHALEWASARLQGAKFDSLMVAWEKAEPDQARLEQMRLRGQIFLGDSVTRTAAVGKLTALEDRELRRVSEFTTQVMDSSLDRAAPFMNEMARRSGGAASPALVDLYLEEGRIEEALALLDRDSSAAGRIRSANVAVTLYRTLGEAYLPRVRAAFQDMEALEPPPAQAANRAFLRTRIASSLNRREDFEQAVKETWAALEPALASGGLPFDTAEFRESLESVFDAVWMADRGRPAEAYERLAVTSLGKSVFSDALGDIAFRAERWRDVASIYEGTSRRVPGRSLAKLRLGRAYEELGERERAVDAYRAFLGRFENADPGLASVEEARAALERLGAA